MRLLPERPDDVGDRAALGEQASERRRQVRLKQPKDFKLIGTRPPRVDSRSKSDGSAVFPIELPFVRALEARKKA